MRDMSNFFSLKQKRINHLTLLKSHQKFFKKDGDKFIIDQIKPVSQNKGTGRLTIQTSLELNVSIPSIAASYDARVQSSNQYTTKINQELISEDISTKELSDALYFSRVCSMIQGLELISKFSNDEKHNISILEVLDNWSGGCIIRSNLLSELKNLAKIMMYLI